MSDYIFNGPMQTGDWKLYREIRPQMTERFFGTLLAQIQELLNESGSSNFA